MEPTSILKAIKHCLPKKSGSPIPLHHASFCGKEWEYDKKCLDTGWVSSVGKYVDELEDPLQAIELAKRQKNFERFFFASTSEVYAGSLKHMAIQIPTPENVPIALTNLEHPRTSYMLSKIYGEAMCHHSNLPFTIVRPHNIYGPRMGMAHVLPELIMKARALPQGARFEVASVDHRRAFCFIDDAVEILRSLASNPKAAGGIFNLGNQEQEMSIGEVAHIVLEATGRTDLQMVPLPETPGSPARRCPDMARTIDLIGCRPMLDLKEGIQRTCKWYTDNVFLGGGVSAI